MKVYWNEIGRYNDVIINIGSADIHITIYEDDSGNYKVKMFNTTINNYLEKIFNFKMCDISSLEDAKKVALIEFNTRLNRYKELVSNLEEVEDIDD